MAYDKLELIKHFYMVKDELTTRSFVQALKWARENATGIGIDESESRLMVDLLYFGDYIEVRMIADWDACRFTMKIECPEEYQSYRYDL